MNTWSQQQQELHESFVNRLYECKPVKKAMVFMREEADEESKVERPKGLTIHSPLQCTHFRLSFIRIWWWKYLPSRDVKKKASKRGRVRFARKIENGQSESSPLCVQLCRDSSNIQKISLAALTPSFFKLIMLNLQRIEPHSFGYCFHASNTYYFSRAVILFHIFLWGKGGTI